MNELIQKKTDFMDIYNKSYRLAAAVFLISNVIDKDEELKTKIKKLCLDLVSMSVSLKDTSFSSAQKLISDIEKNSLELISMLDIASVAGLISQMNGNIIKEEFKAFISELRSFSEKFEENKSVSVKSIFTASAVEEVPGFPRIEGDFGSLKPDNHPRSEPKSLASSEAKNSSNGHKRKDLRKNMILDFIKRHNNVSIKDIVPNVIGCSEKTVQRELMDLIKEGKIKKTGERRWSKYFIS